MRPRPSGATRRPVGSGYGPEGLLRRSRRFGLEFGRLLGDTSYRDAELVGHPLDGSRPSTELALACSLERWCENVGCPYNAFAALGAGSVDRLCTTIYRLVHAVVVNIAWAESTAKVERLVCCCTLHVLRHLSNEPPVEEYENEKNIDRILLCTGCICFPAW